MTYHDMALKLANMTPNCSLAQFRGEPSEFSQNPRFAHDDRLAVRSHDGLGNPASDP